MTEVDALVLKLKKEFGRFAKVLEESEQIIHDNEISQYVIFIFSDQAVELGIELISPKSSNSDWFVYASTLENFATKGLIAAEKIEPFMEKYNEHKSDYCIFSINKTQSNFIFIDRMLHTKSDN